MPVENQAQRIGRVEGDISAVRSEVTANTREVNALKSDVNALGIILSRIEVGLGKAQERSDEREVRSKPNLTAIVSVLITIISVLIGGAWMVSGQLATVAAQNDETSRWRVAHAVELLNTREQVNKLKDRELARAERGATIR